MPHSKFIRNAPGRYFTMKSFLENLIISETVHSRRIVISYYGTLVMISLSVLVSIMYNAPWWTYPYRAPPNVETI